MICACAAHTCYQGEIFHDVLFHWKERIILYLQVEERYDSLMTATSSLTINVIDINDSPPELSRPLYRLSVSEHSSEGSVLLQVTATDTDLVSDNDCAVLVHNWLVEDIFDWKTSTSGF